MISSQSLRSLALGSLMVGSLALGSFAVAAAQDTATAGPSHPAFIESGDCTKLDSNPVATLNPVERHVSDSKDDTANQVVGTLTATPVLFSLSDKLDLKFDDMLSESHSVTIHESQDNIQNYLACGEIGGIVVDDELVVALHPLSDSGYTGIAILTKDGDGNVDVKVYLAEPAKSEPTTDATPAA